MFSDSDTDSDSNASAISTGQKQLKSHSPRSSWNSSDSEQEKIDAVALWGRLVPKVLDSYFTPYRPTTKGFRIHYSYCTVQPEYILEGLRRKLKF
jgi:hypothetical protein